MDLNCFASVSFMQVEEKKWDTTPTSIGSAVGLKGRDLSNKLNLEWVGLCDRSSNKDTKETRIDSV